MTNRTPYIPPDQAEKYSQSSFVNEPAKPAEEAPAAPEAPETPANGAKKQ